MTTPDVAVSASLVSIDDAPDVSLVVPVYDEAESLPELVERIRTACDEAGMTFDVWLIDDGSRDGSWGVIERLAADDSRIRGVRFRRNYGKSAALAVGFERAAGDLVMTLDADLQDDPAEIPAMAAMLREGGYDLVSGWKQKRHDPFEKRLPSKFFNGVTRAISGIDLHDFNSGIKIYRREVVKAVRVYGELHRYVPLLAKWEGYDRIGEKVVQHHARKHGRTKFGLERYLRGFLDLLTVVFLTRYLTRPMHFFGGFGSLAFLAGSLMGLWISVDKLVFGHPIGDRPLLLLAVTLVIVGTVLFCTGLLGELVVRPKMERTDAFDIAEMVGG
ncbi:MAG: glycosyltransferase family 2 protein [Rhodothermales bacterium]|nr:glycosyltransferase family 2 protein [Rhodothermales bacterium]